MKAFDTDVLTEILLGDPTYVARVVTIPPHEQAVPVIVLEELLRGRFHVIRQAEAGQAKGDLARAYALPSTARAARCADATAILTIRR